MKEIDFLDVVGRVDKQYIEECITYKPPKKTNIWVKSMSAIAACLVLAIAAVLAVNHQSQSVIIDENGFHIEDGVLLSYSGSETDITIPDTVETIADFTFLGNQNANKIEVVRLGTGVQKVEVNAFAGLDNLVELMIAENNLSFVYEDGLIMTSDGSILLRYEREGETSFTIPESVRFVAAHAVQGTELEEIDFGDNLEYIGYNAFAGNYALKAIYLPDSVKYISEGAFSGCSSAVDGYIPEGVQFDGEAFNRVPFYLSLKAGRMSPLEEVKRGRITPSEAILQSNLDSLTVQLKYVLATLRGEDYEASDAAMFAYGAAHDHPEVPEGMTVPKSFSMEDLTFTDNGWSNTGIYDVQIHLPAGDYTIVMEAYGYETYEALYWEDVRFRISKLYYLQSPDDADPDDTVTAFGWTAVFGHEGDLYSGITYTHEDGTLIRSFPRAESYTPYVLTFSPEGTRAAVEYTYQGTAYFYIQALNGDHLMEPNYDYNEYLNKYYSQYEAGSLQWIDEDNIEGVNEFGRFRFNIYEFEVTQLDHDPGLYDPSNNAVKTVEHSLDYYTVRMEVPVGWRDQTAYYDLVRRGNGLNDYRALVTKVYGSVPVWIIEEIADDEPQTNANGFSYYTVRDETLGATNIEGKYYFLFQYETQFVFSLAVTVYKDDMDDYLKTVIQPILDSVMIEPTSVSMGVEYSQFQNTIQSMGENDTFPPHSYPFEITGMSVPVYFEMRKYDHPKTLTAYGQTVEINKRVYFYGNCRVGLFEYDGAIIFTWSYYGIGYVYILGDGFTEIIEPDDTASVMLYLDENGALKYKRTNNHTADIAQSGGLCVATGYDDFLYCIGSASVEGGKPVLGDAEEYYTIGDKYDLDLEFERIYSRYYASIEEVFEINKYLPS